MGEVAVVHGMFSWTDLSVPDPEAVKPFYHELFGWESRDEPAGEYGVYTMFSLDGADVAGMGTQPPDARESGIPPMWSSYVSVDDVEAVVERVPELGGTVIMPPMEVMDSGHMAVIQDPTGAVVSLWQTGTHAGADVFNESGAMSWNELATRDLEAALAFYGQLLGWEYDDMETPAGIYKVIMNQGRPNGGILQMNEEWPDDIPAHWMVYFNVDDVEEAAAKVEELGGSISVPPTDIGVGIFAVVGDPAGGTFTLFKSHPEGDEE
jgi:hypothetical protein